jgi:DNA-binding transcriptional ArsR family regulator
MSTVPALPSTLIAAGFHALAEPLRVQILDLLRKLRFAQLSAENASIRHCFRQAKVRTAGN